MDDIRNIKPLMTHKVIPNGPYCKDEYRQCRYLIELGHKTYCGLTYDATDNSRQEVIDNRKICEERPAHIGFKDNYLYSKKHK